MKTFIVLLRGINVGGHRRIKMADLRALLEKVGFSEVTSYIQSGNIILKANQTAGKVKKLVADAIEKKYGFTVQVMVRIPQEWQQAIENNPFPSEQRDPQKLHFTFLDGSPSESALQDLVQFQTEAELFEIRGQVLYVYYSNGAGRSKLTNNFFETKLGVSGTARNWNTVQKISSMVKDSE
jgi:uncharacterized protein (DUF1697 family)